MVIYPLHLIQRKRRVGFTLAEVLISLMIIGLATGGILYGYIMAARRAEYSAYNLAAQSLAIQRIEQSRAVPWSINGEDSLLTSNFTNRVEVLDVPIQGTNITYATNITTITVISTNPPMRMVRVDCIWNFMNKGLTTNTMVTYRSPD